jgi:hypothetical protein
MHVSVLPAALLPGRRLAAKPGFVDVWLLMETELEHFKAESLTK